MNVSGITPYYLSGGKQKNYQKRGDKSMRDTFDAQLNRYLHQSSRKPFRACPCCGGNVFDYDEAMRINDDFYCFNCYSEVKTSDAVIEPESYLEEEW